MWHKVFGCFYLLLALWSAVATLARYERPSDLVFGWFLMSAVLALGVGLLWLW